MITFWQGQADMMLRCINQLTYLVCSAHDHVTGFACVIAQHDFAQANGCARMSCGPEQPVQWHQSNFMHDNQIQLHAHHNTQISFA